MFYSLMVYERLPVFQIFRNLFANQISKPVIADDLQNIMDEHSKYLLSGESFNASELLIHYPPDVEHAKKQLLFKKALSNGLNGQVSVQRYKEISLPLIYQPYTPETKVISHDGYFNYSADDSADNWYMNFAHSDLFHSYGFFMFAQDEIQVTEHPVLACIREMMLNRTDPLIPLTVEDGRPTPVLIRGAQRHLKIDTSKIYGARFARSDESTIKKSVVQIKPPTVSNIIAIEAPVASGRSTYSHYEINAALRSAYSGFRAIVLSSIADLPIIKPVVLHAGNWGCGAYGGNRQLMLTIQIMAARLAGLSKIIFYNGMDHKKDVIQFDKALTRKFKFKPGQKIESVLNRLVARPFHWGISDGN